MELELEGLELELGEEEERGLEEQQPGRPTVKFRQFRSKCAETSAIIKPAPPRNFHIQCL